MRRCSMLGVYMVLLSGCGGAGDMDNPNQPPVVAVQSFTLNEDETLRQSLQASDPDHDRLSFSLGSTMPTHGTVEVQSDGTFTYKPAANYHGVDRFSIRVSDGNDTPVEQQCLLTIMSVNDAPTLQVSGLAGTLDSGGIYPLQVSIDDVDGDPVTLQSSSTVARVEVTGSTYQLRLQTVTSATAAQLQLVADDGHGGQSSVQKAFLITPMNASGLGRTLQGDPQRRKLNLIIVGDGFAANEQQKLRDAAVKFAKQMFTSPEIAAHQLGWNLHVLDAVSAESGVDDPLNNIYRNSLFDGHFNCSNIDRLFCVDDAKVFAYVAQHYPNYDYVLVLGNSSKYGGAGGTLATFTMHDSAPLVAIHELGHAFAGLADEYVDDASASYYLPYYCEGCYANVTRETDVNKVSWRHWFVDPNQIPTLPGQSGVGLFEGSYYHSKGFYRPLSDSFMRTLGAPVGPINGEAWADSLYQTIGMASDIAPAAGTVNHPKGQDQRYQLTLTVGAAQQQVRWWLNGQAQPQWDNQVEVNVGAAQPSDYQLVAEIRDLTGVLRHPNKIKQEVTWHVHLH